MKSIWLTLSLSVCVLSSAMAQQSNVIVDNDKIKITQYTSKPGEDVCGVGMHTHQDHGNILITDAKVKTTYPDSSTDIVIYDAKKNQLTIEKNGKQQVIASYGAFWAKGETHEVMNIGNKPLVYYMIETK